MDKYFKKKAEKAEEVAIELTDLKSVSGSESTWEDVKQKKASTLNEIFSLSAAEFAKRYPADRFKEIMDLRPMKGYINKAANVVCTDKGIRQFTQDWTLKLSGVWKNVGAIVGAEKEKNLVVCLHDFVEVVPKPCLSVQNLSDNTLIHSILDSSRCPPQASGPATLRSALARRKSHLPSSRKT
jgi:hypothetical protein